MSVLTRPRPTSIAITWRQSVLKTLTLCLRESRISVQIVFLLRFTVAFLMSTNSPDSAAGIPPFLAAALAWGLATTYVYLVNGVHDAPEDQLNQSGRPISRGELSPRSATFVSRGLAAVALLIATLVESPLFLALITAQLLCGFAYSAPRIALKSRTSTTVLAVLLLGGLTFAAGWLSGGGTGDAWPVIVFGGALTLWMGAVGALVKDLSDVRGDTAAGRRTALVLWGERRARTVCAITPVAVALLYLATAWLTAPALLPSAVCLLAGAIVTSGLVRATSSDEPRSRSRLPYRAFMCTQYGAGLSQLAMESFAR
ncbi:UbiA family prenyltransferase [Streptomyces decoyicus]|uniref:UbiA family prenyltransferase n=2 Tax=Streptomyces decoyicus TaxID=249567 RepID=UPI00345C9F1D